jgi:type VI secretion system protein ImpE
MSVQELFRAGKLQESIQALSAELRDHPGDTKRRTFLFELLCFTGDYGRAEKHLNILAEAGPDAEMGVLLYRSALSAERKRRAFFETKQYGEASMETCTRSGKLNGVAFRTIEDIDPRIGARLEVFIAGEYVWLPLEHIGTLTMQAPRYLRDTLWASATVTASPAMKGQDFGEVLVPVLYPNSAQHERDDVRLGRETDWITSADEPIQIPYGQKMLVLDGEEGIPFLEIRTLEFDDAAAPAPE